MSDIATTKVFLNLYFKLCTKALKFDSSATIRQSCHFHGPFLEKSLHSTRMCCKCPILGDYRHIQKIFKNNFFHPESDWKNLLPGKF